MYGHTKFATIIGQPIRTQENDHHNMELKLLVGQGMVT
jgi:hypothetical protein